MQLEARVLNVRIFVNMVYTLGIEQGRTAFNTVHFIAFAQQKLCQIGTILPGYAGD